MTKARGLRGVIAGVFLIVSAGIGIGMGAGFAGAGVEPPNGTAPPNGDGIRCLVENGNNENGDTIDTIVAPAQNGNGRVGQCAQLEVTKVVTGTPQPSPAPGTTFAVVVDCVPTEENGMVPRDGVEAQQLPQGQTPPFTTTLTFPEGGGTQSVFITRPSECTVSETPPPGCTLTSIDPVTTQVTDPILFPVTVTNNCDPPVEPAAVVVVTPRFTG